MTIKDLTGLVEKYNPEYIPDILNAYELADNAHHGQLRQSGEPYIIHPLNVAYTLAEMHADKDTVIAGLLHDVVEDSHYSTYDIERLFGKEVAKLVDGVTKLSRMQFNSKKEENSANTRKIITSITDDVRIIIVKLADRLHNMRTLQYKKKDKQIENAFETLDIFVPLANHIGAYRIKTELEDLSFKYLKPSAYQSIEEELEKIKKESDACLKEILFNINGLLTAEEIPHEIKTRTKNLYGIYKDKINNSKMLDIHDLFTLKVMVDDIKNCYITMMLVHSVYRPLNSELKDYIANSKKNLYRSLHTTVFGPDGRLVQTQIRTFEMDKIASFGLTAYWDINGMSAREKMQKDLKKDFIKSINYIDSTFDDNGEFVTQVTNELFKDTINVYTSKGDIIELPKGATPIDFAYKIHTKIGENISGVLINDVLSNITTPLKDDDRVIILTDGEKMTPTADWLNHTKTTKAKRKIKDYNKRRLTE